MSTTLNKGGLSAEKIAELLAGSRTRNSYGPHLVEFINSDEPAINPAEVWSEFAGKKATTLYQGFRNAALKADPPLIGTPDSQLVIIMRDDNVYILHRERANFAAQATDTDTDE